MIFSNKLWICCIVCFLLLVCLPYSASSQGALNALQLDGEDDHAVFSNNNRGITNQLTVEAWIKTDATGRHHIVSKYDRDAEHGFQLLIQQGKAGLAGRDGSGTYRFSGYSSTHIADDNWHHIAGVVDDGIWKIYVDGELQNQAVTAYKYTILASNEKLLLGNYYYPNLGNHFYRGTVDEVKLWNKALSTEEIRQYMCRSVPAGDKNLVGYFKLNSTTDNVIVDHSSMKMNGTLQNTSPSLAGVSSGAPIGDSSVFRYNSKWNYSLELVTGLANFSVHNGDPAIRGFHLYTIKTPPASVQGIVSPADVQEYFGVFKVGEADKKYKVYFKQYDLKCGSILYRRPDNTVSTWNHVADTTTSPSMYYTTSANYGEYLGTAQAGRGVKISAPAAFCSGSPATLRASYNGAGNLLWSTGETTAAISIKETGTYWVELTTPTGCTTRDEINATFNPQSNFPLFMEVPTCGGEAVILDATEPDASYTWSNGQTTSSITATATGSYYATLAINGCQYVKEFRVTNGECLVIPNIITPNGDGKNEVFEVQGIESSALSLKIVNRWGIPVYQTPRYTNNWDAEGIPAGMYFYQFTSSKTKKVYNGWLEVLR